MKNKRAFALYTALLEVGCSTEMALHNLAISEFILKIPLRISEANIPVDLSFGVVFSVESEWMSFCSELDISLDFSKLIFRKNMLKRLPELSQQEARALTPARWRDAQQKKNLVA